MGPRYLLVAGLMLFVACAPGATPSSTSIPVTASVSSPPPTSSSPTALLSVDVMACEQASEAWIDFCQVYELIDQHYVDDPGDLALARGAVRGLALAEPGPITGDLSCALPSRAFEDLCDRLTSSPLPGTDRANARAALEGMINFGLGDPYSVYLSPEAVERLREDDSGEVEGIGALVSAEDAEGQTCAVISGECRLVIVGTIPGSPAEAAGLQQDDVIVGVDGTTTEGVTVDEVVSLVRGPAGSTVTLSVARAGSVLEVSLQRAAVSIPIVAFELLDPAVGYLHIALFTDASPALVRDALKELLDQGATQLVLDLQDNPGGTLDSAVRVASEFLERGLVLKTEAPGETLEYAVEEGGLATDPRVRLVVLVNEASASASEVVAAALQEAGRAVVIGEASFGKNTVQRQFSLREGAVKLTIARWTTPSGVDYGETGITPDVVVPLEPGDDRERLVQEARAYLAGA